MSDFMKCPDCGRLIGAYVPSRGDGTAVRLRRHLRPDRRPEQVIGALPGTTSKWCAGSDAFGVWRNGKWVDL